MLLLPLQIGNLTKWLKGLPLARRPLVKLNAKVAPEPAVKMLQSALPPRSKEQAAVELENVAATLLLPPTGALGWVGWAAAEPLGHTPPKVRQMLPQTATCLFLLVLLNAGNSHHAVCCYGLVQRRAG